MDLVEELRRQNKALWNECLILETERIYYMYLNSHKQLYAEYIGSYNEAEKTLVVCHSVEGSKLFPYGNAWYEGACGDYPSDTLTVAGSWDSWKKVYPLFKKCVRSWDNIYEGCVFYIQLEEPLAPGEYEFKFKDGDRWVEPVQEGDDPTESLNALRCRDGIWNAVLQAHEKSRG